MGETLRNPNLQKGLDAVNKYINKQLGIHEYQYFTWKSKKFWDFHVLAKIYEYPSYTLLRLAIKKWKDTLKTEERRLNNLKHTRVIEILEKDFSEIH